MDEQRLKLMDEYFRYTRELLPKAAADNEWAAMEESHFQRIVLDNLVGGVWYGKIKEPAVLHLSKTQLKKAIRICEQILDGAFEEMNQRSLDWRERMGVPPDLELYQRKN